MNNKISFKKGAIICLAFLFAMSLISCKKLIDSVEPKSFVDKFYDQTLNYEWTVDEFRYTKYDEAQKEISDELKPVGKIVFTKPVEESNNAVLGFGQGYMTHTYTQAGTTVVDKMAYRLKNSGTEIKYLEIYFKLPTATTFIGASSVIYDIQQLDKNTYHLYRYEHLQDTKTGQWQGYLRSTIKMHK